ncbi:hypothetical protein B0H19DRAFT_1265484 [Mycena capillaripes]|nr:hypothetical protein B0H19DRAFT_1265484 [Mycena capillaripes]
MFNFMNNSSDPGGYSGTYNGTLLENQIGGPDEGHNDADGEDNDVLEYIGPPYAAPAPLYANDGDMEVSGCFVSQKTSTPELFYKVNQSAFNRLSQKLPPLLPLPASYTSHDDPDEHTTNVFDDIE